MKRDFLEGLGLEKDVIDKVMAENGKDVEAEKAKVKAAESQRDKVPAARISKARCISIPRLST